MTETRKTLLFVVVAAVAVAAALASQWFARPADSSDTVIQKELFPEFTEPLAVADMEIVQFDEATSTLRPFRVALTGPKGKLRWSIPSHEDYPADAKDQMALAAAGVLGLKTVEVVSEDQGDQAMYGVVEPDTKLRVGATGVGTRVVMKDKRGKELLSLVIGKEVPDRPGLRYVRKTGENAIRVVEVKTDKLSTKFHDWIERNLLQINVFDLKQIWIRDYYVDVANAEVAQRGDMRIDYDDAATPRWKLVEDRRFEGTGWTPIKMAASEELNAAKLDDLLTALGDLKIIDISQKPAGLSADLKASKGFSDHEETVRSLASKGFFLANFEGHAELFSNEGEIHLQMKDGVEYVLRFGSLAGGTGAAEKAKSKDDKADPNEKEESRLNRYLFVMAQFDPQAIPKPKLEPLPEPKKNEPKKPDAKQPDANKTKAGKADAKKSVAKSSGEKGSDAATEAAERRRLEKENKRRQEEYEQKIADGKKRVAELNARFADWYYVISDEVYQKIHLTRNDLVQKKSKSGKGANGNSADKPSSPSLPPEVLEQLRKKGLDGK